MASGVSSWLRRVLVADGAISGATGLLLFLGAGPLHELLGLPSALLRWAGLSLVPFAALVVHLARRPSLPRAGVWAVIATNAAWVAGSVLVLLGGFVAPNGLGYAFVLGQAFAVALLGEAQYVGLRRSAATSA